MKKIVAPFLRTAYNYDTNQAGDDAGLHCEDPTLAKQSFAEECDINTIVRRFNVTGQLPVNVRMPSYQDFIGIFDYHTALNSIAKANESFDRMPATVRARFNNDPAEFVEFCSKAENQSEAVKLGLVAPAAAALAGGPAPAAEAPQEPREAPKGGKKDDPKGA